MKSATDTRLVFRFVCSHMMKKQYIVVEQSHKLLIKTLFNFVFKTLHSIIISPKGKRVNKCISCAIELLLNGLFNIFHLPSFLIRTVFLNKTKKVLDVFERPFQIIKTKFSHHLILLE